MHTATRLAVPLIRRVLRTNPDAHVCCYGLYAPMNEPFLREIGVRTVIGGEFEEALAALADGWTRPQALISLDRLQFLPPERSLLPPLSSYATLSINGSMKRSGSTAATRVARIGGGPGWGVPATNGSFGSGRAEMCGS